MYAANQGTQEQAVSAITAIMEENNIDWTSPDHLDAETEDEVINGFFDNCNSMAADDKDYWYDLCDTYMQFGRVAEVQAMKMAA